MTLSHVIFFLFFFNDTATTEIYTTDTLFPYTTLFRSHDPAQGDLREHGRKADAGAVRRRHSDAFDARQRRRGALACRTERTERKFRFRRHERPHGRAAPRRAGPGGGRPHRDSEGSGRRRAGGDGCAAPPLSGSQGRNHNGPPAGSSAPWPPPNR